MSSRTLVLLGLLAACAADEAPVTTALAAPSLAPPLAEPVLLKGQSNRLRSSGYLPGDRITMAISTSPPGAGPCPPSLPRCLDLVNPIVVGVEVADAAGEAVFDLVPPAGAPDTLITLQTASPQSGRMSGASRWWVLSPGDDLDGDGLDNADEVAVGTNPFDADTDGGGALDGAELAAGLDPVNDDIDDTLFAIGSIRGTVTVALDFSQHFSPGRQDCTVTYRLATTSTPAVQPDFFSSDVLLLAFGDWEIQSHTCSPSVMQDLRDDFVWSDPTANNRFQFAFDPAVSVLRSWIVYDSRSASGFLRGGPPPQANQFYVDTREPLTANGRLRNTVRVPTGWSLDLDAYTITTDVRMVP